MVGLTSSESHNSTFNITEENNKFEPYTDTYDELSFAKLKNELEEVLSNSDITPKHLQHEKIGPPINQAYMKIRSKNSSTDGYLILLMDYARSPFGGFESYPRIVVGVDEDDIQMILGQYSSFFSTHEIPPGIYTIEDISEEVHSMVDHEGTLQMEYDDIRMETKIIFTQFRLTFGTLRFDEKSYFST